MFRWETKRLVLRPFEENDLEIFAAYRSDPQVARFQGWDAPYSLLSARAFFVLLQALEPGLPGEWYQFAVADRATGRLLGDLGLLVLKTEPEQAEFGVTLARENQGKGYAAEALQRLFAYCFETLKLHRVFSRLDTRNTASARLMERLGMRQEAHFLQSAWYKGEWTDEYWYAILADDWYQRRQACDAGSGNSN
jgi:RimJ/RimL family protein N-acetyltransferase